MSRTKAALLFLGIWFAVGHVSARAGGGPERTLVVVNSRSPVSLRVAHEYQRLRSIPDSHMVYLPGVPDYYYPGQAAMTLTECKESILVPILDYLDAQKLLNEIDVITYAPGFPYIINITELANDHVLRPFTQDMASLTGVTYFASAVVQGRAEWVRRHANAYFRGGISMEGEAARPMNEAEAALRQEAQDAYYQQKNFAAALKSFQELVQTYREDGGVWYDMACVQSLLGLKSQALDSLERAVGAGWSHSFHTTNDPDLAGLRSESRFAQLVGKMKQREPRRYPSHGFRTGAVWGQSETPQRASVWDASRLDDGGYYLSTLLGYTGVRGNSVPEILSVLETSSELDGTRPGGTVYLMKNSDMRSRGRQLMFEPFLEEMRTRSRKAQILTEGEGNQDGVLPLQKKDVLGAVIGTADFDWSTSKSTMVPGALVENATSWGCAYWAKDETKISEFFRHGAVGSSGGVVSSSMTSFPAPFLHCHYFDGSSLAESFYQSVSSPYTLLVVGDPLVKPFAPITTVPSSWPEGPWSGEVSLKVLPDAGETTSRAETVEAWIDGWQVAEAFADRPLKIDTRDLDDGFHDFRLVTVDSSLLEHRAFAQAQIEIRNHQSLVHLEEIEPVRLGEGVALKGTASGAQKVEVYQGERYLRDATPTNGEFLAIVSSDMLGPGKSFLHVRAVGAEDRRVRSRRREVWVQDPAKQRALKPAQWSLPGVAGIAVLPNGDKESFSLTSLAGATSSSFADVCSREGWPEGTKLELQGEFHAPLEGFYELHLYSTLEGSISCAGKEFAAPQWESRFESYYLEEGWHEFSAQLTTNEYFPQFHAYLSGAAPGFFLGGEQLRHVPGSRAPVDDKPQIQLHGSYGAKFLTDRDREGESQIIPSGEITLSWDKYQSNLRGVLLFPASPEIEGEWTWPEEWIVEKRSGRNWSKVANLDVQFGWSPERGPRKTSAPSWVYLDFSPVKVRELRLRPSTPAAGGLVRIAEVEVAERSSKRR